MKPLSSGCFFPSSQPYTFITHLLFALPKPSVPYQTPWCLAGLFRGVMPHSAVSAVLVLSLMGLDQVLFPSFMILGLLLISSISKYITTFPRLRETHEHVRSIFLLKWSSGGRWILCWVCIGTFRYAKGLGSVLSEPWVGESVSISFLIRFFLSQGTHAVFLKKNWSPIYITWKQSCIPCLAFAGLH